MRKIPNELGSQKKNASRSLPVSSAVTNFVTSNEITSNRYFLSNCNGN
jgi:hypothetical protein